MEIELIEAWVQRHAPASIKLDLVWGIRLAYSEKIKIRKKQDKFPNSGSTFTEEENKRLIELNHESENKAFYLWFSYERERAIEKEFGRSMKSLRGNLRRIHKSVKLNS